MFVVFFALFLSCAGGVTTAKIGEYAKVAHGIDYNKSERVKKKQAELQSDNVFFHDMDAFDISSIRKLGNFNKIFIDISGNRALGPVTQLIESYEQVFRPELIVVKSHRLAKLLKQSEVFEPEKAQNI